MAKTVNDFSITVATVNGSGSQSANNILMRALFRSGVPVAGKNLFPSNIAGLPTWFTIRVSEKGFVGRRPQSEVVVAMNKETLFQDFEYLKPGGLFIYNSNLRFAEVELPPNVNLLPVPFNDLAKDVSDSIQLKKLLVNMIYVGVLAELLEVSDEVMSGTIEHQFRGKESVYSINKKAVEAGRSYVRENLKDYAFPLRIEPKKLTQNKILIEGNTASALGLVYAGCSFVAWYPITPSSSLVESFESQCRNLRTNKKGEKLFSVIQSEDELSAISMVAGAGWAGARAMTATSGPGVSLMGETIGLMYFAEIPGVIWDVQRMGPSTGLPTRTSQGDILSAVHCSHGDTRHPVLFPANPKECFEFALLAFDLAERAQTPVFVLTDLDLGMNTWMSDRFDFPDKPFDRGKVLKKEDLEKRGEFARYADVDGDGIPYRTLPGTDHDLAAYFTRGTGHTPEAKYSERADNYQDLLNRLDRKWETMKTLIPSPIVHCHERAKTGLIFFGTTDLIIPELLQLLGEGIYSTLRLKAYPFHRDVQTFVEKHDRILVIEQNQHGQMTGLLRSDFPRWADKIFVHTSCDGLPLCPEILAHELKSFAGGNSGH